MDRDPRWSGKSLKSEFYWYLHYCSKVWSQQGQIKLIKSGSKKITKDFYFKCIMVSKNYAAAVFNTDSTKKHFLSSKLAWFLKDHVTLKTGVMTQNTKYRFAITGINSILLYIKIGYYSYFSDILKVFHSVTIFTVFWSVQTWWAQKSS